MKGEHIKLVILLAVVLLILGTTGGALASDQETSIILQPGHNEFTYTVEFDPIEELYASAQFDITVSDKNELTATEITFDKDNIVAKAGEYGDQVDTIKSGGRVNGNQVLYQAGFFSPENSYENEGSICTVTFQYTGSTPQTVKFDKLELWRLTGKVTNGIPELKKETLDWSRTIQISRGTPPPPTVAKPTAIPGTGTYESVQHVTLSCATAGAEIYYTTNGSTPTSSSTPYTGPITVDRTMTIKAFAVKSGYEDSEVAEFAYTIHTGGGGTGSGGKEEKPPIVSETKENTTSVSTVTTSTTDSTGTTTAAVDQATAEKLVTAAKSAEKEGTEAVVVIEIKTTEQTRSVELTIPRNALDRLAKETDANLKIDSGIGTITFDANAVESISGAQGSEDVKVSMEKVDNSTLTEAQQKTVGDRPVYDFSVTAGSQLISSLGGGSANISVPYTLRDGEDKNAIVVYFIDESGNPQEMRGAYHEATGTVVFTVTHFSKYFIGYHKVSFIDVASGAWYSDAVNFIAARGITTGTEPGKFSPNAAITRGQYIVMLMKAYGIAPEENPQDNFADAGNTYYTGYLAAAKDLKITQGTGDNKYNPGGEITRQDMVTLLYRSLDLLGELPEGDNGARLSGFADGTEISDYAKEAMEALVKGGIITGSNGKLDLKGRSTRAQMAQVLYNLLSENVAQ
ncbi:chitobiase/beta-hexosaminidase C-terminal domain-containing protein [Candidatus Formimonas warabiya]|uniref:SLH domain-containing protein n=1 Tax=Formimonas warabiya TaxID=1761012 RepID=A0A3G1KUP3_FORW1|nr:chitobiase/beta-hexosaminidase C-terminal domain-containing protein [Candidatus Formimonas warabiya]ATW26161.1 hypothetical protein DCMF_16520 [Candidatus Formimonas warabiya]